MEITSWAIVSADWGCNPTAPGWKTCIHSQLYETVSNLLFAARITGSCMCEQKIFCNLHLLQFLTDSLLTQSAEYGTFRRDLRCVRRNFFCSLLSILNSLLKISGVQVPYSAHQLLTARTFKFLSLATTHGPNEWPGVQSWHLHTRDFQ